MICYDIDPYRYSTAALPIRGTMKIELEIFLFPIAFASWSLLNFI